MAQYLYNGVLLPEIPADVLAEYPYATIILRTNGTYRLLVSKNGFFKQRAYDSVDEKTVTIHPSYLYSGDNAEWTNENNTANSAWSFASIVWSNHDIPFASADSTEIYFYGSEPVDPNAPDEPEVFYKISGARLTDIADAIRVKTGKADPLTLEQMATEIEGIEAGGSAPDGMEVTFGYENDEPVAREEAYTVLSEMLNEIGEAVQTLAGKTSLMTLEEMLHHIKRAQFLPENARLYYVGNAVSELNLSALNFESSAVGELQEG